MYKKIKVYAPGVYDIIRSWFREPPIPGKKSLVCTWCHLGPICLPSLIRLFTVSSIIYPPLYHCSKPPPPPSLLCSAGGREVTQSGKPGPALLKGWVVVGVVAVVAVVLVSGCQCWHCGRHTLLLLLLLSPHLLPGLPTVTDQLAGSDIDFTFSSRKWKKGQNTLPRHRTTAHQGARLEQQEGQDVRGDRDNRITERLPVWGDYVSDCCMGRRYRHSVCVVGVAMLCWHPVRTTWG